ncbi:MAG: dihydrolipoyl dehydrogenase [Gammaproteobacteria bacterium]|nr:dihydrolipoyl dehydrogenase [Gammaproteobacteria bacterium]
MTRQVDVAIVGAGTAGLAAMAQVRRAGCSFVLIDGGELGTTCARVGCMPSKALLQVAEDFARRRAFSRLGIDGGEALELDGPKALEHVRDLRDIFVDRVLAGTTDELGEEFIAAPARFTSLTTLLAGDQRIEARRVVIAVGSRPFVPPDWAQFAPQLLTTDTVFELESLPQRLAVIGLGAVGLEIGQALARLGVEVTGFDRLSTVAGLQDVAVSEVAVQAIGRDFPLHLGNAARIEATAKGLRVVAGEREAEVDKVLLSMGRVSNAAGLGLSELGVPVDAAGVPLHDPASMQIGDLPLFIAGDADGARQVLHEAADEGRIAGYNAARDITTRFRRRVALHITFCDPNTARVGTPFEDLDSSAAIGEMPFGPVGRALIMGKNRGLLRVYARARDGRILGAEICGPKCENLAHLLAWSVQQELGVLDLLRMPYYHPVIEEALQAALHDLLAKLDLQPSGLLEFVAD